MTWQEAQARAERELSTLTVDDWTNLLIIGGVSLVGVWIMTLPERVGGGEPADEEDVCALCGSEIDPTSGAVFPGPAAQRRLGLYPGEAICKSCSSAYRARR